MYIDQTMYPDLSDPPEHLASLEARADYVHRVCSAWDFHVHPDRETFEMCEQWKDVFDRFPLSTSPAYHAFRDWFGWEPMKPVLGLPVPTPTYIDCDRLEERPADPCENLI